MMSNERRIMGAYIGADVIGDFLIQDEKVYTYYVIEGFPAGSEVVSVNWDPMKQMFLVIFSHDSFGPKPEGYDVEIINIEVKVSSLDLS